MLAVRLPESVLHCPFCGAEETDRIRLEGSEFLVFRCMFTAKVGPELSDPEKARTLVEAYGGQGDQYFRGMCDALHYYVTKGAGARVLAPGGSGHAPAR